MNELEVDPLTLQHELRSPNPPVLLDVREPEELDISVLPGVVNIPVGDLLRRMNELDPGSNVVVVCRTGNRSGWAVMQLKAKGFQHVRNLVGGMNSWSDQVDTSVAKY